MGGAWVVAFSIWDTGTLWAALVFAVSAGVIAMSHWLTSD